jgi:short-subunit dehydrogenase
MARLFADQAAVITGGSSGLGLAMARALLSEGAHVYLLARNRERLELACEELRRESTRVNTLVADVTSQSDVEQAFAEVRRHHASLKVLVNAAGLSHRGAILEITPEAFQSLWDLNFLGTVRCTRAAADDLLRAQGHLVNVGSLASKVVAPYLGAYPVSKFAVAAYTQQLRLELGPRGLHVLLVCPGPLRRNDAGRRYDDQAEGLPATARRPAAGARLKAIDPDVLARRIVLACRRHERELVVPGKVRWLAALNQLAPAWADWLIRRNTRSAERG